MTMENLADEAYRQGKVYMADHVLALIGQGGTAEEIVARVTARLEGFKTTREEKAEAVAELKKHLGVTEVKA